MKKLTFIAVALMLAVTAGAANANRANWSKNINSGKLGNYLNLAPDQRKEVSMICEYFTQELEKASYAKKDQQKKLQKAVYGNLKLMKQTLTPEQYARYTTLINLTLRNRGIELNNK